MGDSLDGSGEPSPESQNVAIVDYNSFANYLRKTVVILLPDEEALPPAFSASLDDKNNQEAIRKFLSDSQVWALYVQRSYSKGEQHFIILLTTYYTVRHLLIRLHCNLVIFQFFTRFPLLIYCQQFVSKKNCFEEVLSFMNKNFSMFS